MTRMDGRYWVCFKCRGPVGTPHCTCGSAYQRTEDGGMGCINPNHQQKDTSDAHR